MGLSRQKQNAQRAVKFVKSSQSSELISRDTFFSEQFLLFFSNFQYYRLGKVYRHHYDAQMWDMWNAGERFENINFLNRFLAL